MRVAMNKVKVPSTGRKPGSIGVDMWGPARFVILGPRHRSIWDGIIAAPLHLHHRRASFSFSFFFDASFPSHLGTCSASSFSDRMPPFGTSSSRRLRASTFFRRLIPGGGGEEAFVETHGPLRT